MKILVLGDSSSAGIGDGRAVFPFKLYELLRAGRDVVVDNHAVPGFTSSDLARYYVELSDHDWDYVIVYVGNNEGSRSKYKGAYRPRWLDSWRRRTGPRLRPMHAITDRPQFTFDAAEPQGEVANTPADTHANLALVAERAVRRGSRVIVINPVANVAFPAGVGSPRSPFLKIIGLPTRVADRLVGADQDSEALIAAIRRHERGDVDGAVAAYHALANATGHVAMVARNNLGVAMTERGASADAVRLFEQLVDDQAPDAAVALANLARISRRNGDSDGADQHARAALVADTTLYRVKPAYREAIAALGVIHGVTVVDMAPLVDIADFVDYCHPMEAAHGRLARAIADRIDADAAPRRVTRSAYRWRFPSPDAFFHPQESLAGYYSIAFDVAHADVVDAARAVTALLPPSAAIDSVSWPAPSSTLDHNVLHTFRHAAAHPVITAAVDFERFPPRYGWEIGTFPEYYVYRIIATYLRHAEAVGSLDALAGAVRGEFSLSADTYLRRILTDDEVALHEPDFSLAYARAILARVKRDICGDSRAFADVRAERITTVMYWYTREAFRYGTQSRYSMLYDRWAIERLVEALGVCGIIARHHACGDLEHEVNALLGMLMETVQVHERFARVTHDNGYDIDADAYATTLRTACAEGPHG